MIEAVINKSESPTQRVDAAFHYSWTLTACNSQTFSCQLANAAKDCTASVVLGVYACTVAG